MECLRSQFSVNFSELRYLVKRALSYVVVFFVALNLDFAIPRLAPGSAVGILASGSRFAPEAAKLLVQRFGLDQPVTVQYVDFIKNIFATWPPFLGLSYEYYPQPVITLIATRVTWTMLLVIPSLFLSFFLAYLMTALSSQKRGGRTERGFLYAAITMHAIPIYWTAMTLLWVFAVWLGWLPEFGNVAFGNLSGWQFVQSVAYHMVLPLVALSLSPLGELYLLLRGSTQEVLQSDYVVAAKIRGLSGKTLAFSYIVRNSLLPIISITAYSFSAFISRVVLVESVFGYPGLGDLLVDAATSRDYPVLTGSLLFITLIVVIGGFIGDVLLVRLDPRLRK